MEGSETMATPNERLEVLNTRYVSTPDNQHQLEDGNLSKIMDRDLYEATKKGELEGFINALEKVVELRKLALSLIFEQVTPSGNSLLHVAASSGSDEVINLILSYFPDTVTQKNSLEDTPLHVAVQDQRFNAIEKLISLGTDSEIIYWKNKNNKSPLYLAIEMGKGFEWRDRQGAGWEIFQLLLEAFAQDEAYAVKIQGKSPILAAIESWNTELLREIIDRLPKLLPVRDESDENGWTPLHYAASKGRYKAVELLLQKCPDLALQTDKNGSYPIHIACESWFGPLEPLIDGTWPDLAEIKNENGQNILHVAAKAGNLDGVHSILKNCRERDIETMVNSTDADGNTPLHLASMHNHCQVMRSLTKVKRIKFELRNNAGLTALDEVESESLSTENSALLGRAILIVAGVPLSKGPNILSPEEQCSGASKPSPAKWIKEHVNTLLIVATVVASVTFAAGITLPSGYNASNDSHPGMATMLHHGMFQFFVIANTIAMYSSTLAVVVLLWGLSKDFKIAELAYNSAGPLLLMALAGMSVAFFVAVTVAVSKLIWLRSLVLSIGIIYLVMIVVVLAVLIFPSAKCTMHIVLLCFKVISVIRCCLQLIFGVYKCTLRESS